METDVAIGGKYRIVFPNGRADFDYSPHLDSSGHMLALEGELVTVERNTFSNGYSVAENAWTWPKECLKSDWFNMSELYA